MDVREAIAQLAQNFDSTSVYQIKGKDYAFKVDEAQHLYLVVEAEGRGIFLARFAPDFMRPRPLLPEEQAAARELARQRLKEAGLWPSTLS
ncbi:hypothetical protein [Desulfothermobacter acidiphilus]|uniref:hypothetical protein n=1 Tax=Desulfothermobacter acidiphilus TaxID=1938353 RepID=UPI003F8BC151